MKKIILFLLFGMIVISCTRTTEPSNSIPTKPVISLYPNKIYYNRGEEIIISALATDDDGDSLTYIWSTNPNYANVVVLSVDSLTHAARIKWSSNVKGIYTVTCKVKDGRGGENSNVQEINVANRNPEILSFEIDKTTIPIGESIICNVNAIDPDSDAITFSFYLNDELIYSGSDTTASISNFTTEGIDSIKVIAKDQYGGASSRSTAVVVYNKVGCVWVLNKDNGYLTKVSEKGYKLREIKELVSPMDIKLDQDYNYLWISDASLNKLVMLNSETDDTLTTYSLGLSYPTYLAIDKIHHHVWISDTGNNSIKRFNFITHKVDAQIDSVYNPSKLSLNYENGKIYLYVIESEYQRVKMFDVSEINNIFSVATISSFSEPIDICSDDNNRLWILDRSADKVYYYANMILIDLKINGLNKPKHLFYDEYHKSLIILNNGDNNVVIADLTNIANPSSISLSLPISNAQGVSVNNANGYVWISDSGNNRLVKLVDNFSQIYFVNQSFNYPVQLEVYSGTF